MTHGFCVASFSLEVVGVMVMLAGRVLGSAVFCDLKLSGTIKYLTQ